MTKFSPLMLTMARESRKLSQTALAREAGITQSAISQMESGVIAAPKTLVVHQLAQALSYRPSLFYVSVRFQQLPITFFRKRRMGAKDVAAIRAKVNLLRLRLETLLKADEYDGPRLLQIDTDREGLTPAQAAQRLRVYWNLQPGPIHDLTTLVESHGVVVVPMDFGTGTVDGLSLYEPRDVLPPMVFINRTIPADRWRLTLAHELGHIVMHHHLRIPPPQDQLEDEAFSFAVELMAPLNEVAGQIRRITMQRLASLKVHWGLSMAAFLKLAGDMGNLTEDQKSLFWRRLRGGTVEPIDLEPERPTYMRDLVKRHLEEFGYSLQDLSDALHMNPDELRADFGLGAPLRLA